MIQTNQFSLTSELLRIFFKYKFKKKKNMDQHFQKKTHNRFIKKLNIRQRYRVSQIKKKKLKNRFNKKKWICPICLDDLVKPVVSPCGHIFCWPCIYKWLRRSNTCPVCKSIISEQKLIPIYGQGEEADLNTNPLPPIKHEVNDDFITIQPPLDRDDFFFTQIDQSTLPSFNSLFTFTHNSYFQIFAITFFILSFILH